MKITNEELIKLSHLTTSELSKRFGISRQSLHQRFKRLGIERDKQKEFEKSINKRRIHNVNLKHFKPVDEIGSYYLGLLYADGSIDKQNRISITLKEEDKETLINMANNLGLTTSIVRYQSNKSYKLAMSDFNFTRICKHYGLDTKNKIPKEISHKDFVRGFLDGDGYISIKKRKNHKFLEIGFAIASEEFGKSLTDLIEKEINIKLNGLYKMKSIWCAKCSHKKARILAHWLWDNSKVSMCRKRIKYLSTL